MKKIIFLFSAFYLCMTLPTWSQSPLPTFLYSLGLDFNHYSIEQSPQDDSYVIAGTLFHPSGDTEIHLLKIDFNGFVVWEVTANPGFDDRALDVVVEPGSAEIVVVGYTDRISSNPNIYMGRWDAGGGFINDYVININNAGPSFPCAATNIIYSQSTGQYIVGGFWAENFNYPLVAHNYSILFNVDPNLTAVNWVSHFTSSLAETNSSINDILETSTGIVFATGSMGMAGGTESQGVLAMTVDPGSGAMLQNLSFESTNWEHVGVSAVYDDTTDEVWLMSNNSLVHNPQINLIRDVSGSPFVEPSVSYYLEIDNTYGSYNAAGFSLLPHYDHPHDALVATGYFRTKGPSGNDATMWYVEFERYGGGPLSSGLEWMAPSANFHTHGGGLFSTFSGEHPYIFNQEIMVSNLQPSSSTSRYVVLTPSDHSGNYGIDIVPMPGYSDCLDRFNWDPIPHPFNLVNVMDYSSPPNFTTSLGVSSGFNSYQKEWCKVKPREDDENNSQLGISEMMNITISPNPARERISIIMTGGDSSGQLTIRDVAGKLIYQSNVTSNTEYQLDLTNYQPGLYFVQYQNGGTNNFGKFVKQ